MNPHPILLAGALVVIAGSVLPWRVTSYAAIGTTRIPGLYEDGWITLIFGILMTLPALDGRVRSRKWVILLGVILAFAAALIAGSRAHFLSRWPIKGGTQWAGVGPSIVILGAFVFAATCLYHWPKTES